MSSIQEHVFFGKRTPLKTSLSQPEADWFNTRLDMDVTLAYPKGYDLDPEVMKRCEK
jgi:ornithine carbamoyltransferase